ncbi:MAG: hypothetical protein HYY90_04240 [Candidatus Omnitrophica bacterium]|nr:hypothetical protein [Candidatus Omnitrophota bacterium]MBI3021204.1 hypothetical protein [Candidatus Omnitrophota bacterium]MBI3083554.1 hypothetical protein [Candidatus Omnitrophota bacterium]
MAECSQFGIRMRRGEHEIEVWGDQKFVETHFERLTNEQKSPQAMAEATGAPARPEDVQGKQWSMTEFLRKIGAKKHPHKILAMGYYIEKIRGQAPFTRAQIIEAYKQAKEPYSRETNVYRDFGRCEQRGWLMEAEIIKEGEKTFQVTSTGERLIEEQLKGNGSSVE